VLLGGEEEEGKEIAEFDKSRLCQRARAGNNSEYKEPLTVKYRTWEVLGIPERLISRELS
jgi:hypothetical protein